MNAQNTDNLAMKELEQKMKEAFKNLKEQISDIEKAWTDKIGSSQDHRKQLEERTEDRIPVRTGNSCDQMDLKYQEQLGNIILEELEKTRERLRWTMQKLEQLHEVERKELQTEEIENLQIDFDEESFDFIGGESERNNGGGGVHEDEDTYICKDKGNNTKLETIITTQEGTTTNTTAAAAAAAAPAETTTITINPSNTPALNPSLEKQQSQIHETSQKRQSGEINQLEQEQLASTIEPTSQQYPQQQQLPPVSNKPSQLQYQMLLQQQQRQFELLNQQFQQQQRISQDNGLAAQNYEEPLDTIDEECPSKEIFQLERNYSLQIKSLGFMAQVLQCHSGECFVFAKYGDFNTLRGPFSKQGAILLFEERVGLQRAQLFNKDNTNQNQQNK